MIAVAGVQRVVFRLQSVHRRLEGLQDAVEINRIGELTSIVLAFSDNPVGGKFADDIIIEVEFYAVILGCDTHQNVLKAWVSADVSREVHDIHVAFVSDFLVRR